MDSLVTVLAVAVWMLLMVPAALIMFVGGTSVDQEEPAAATLRLLAHAEDGTDERAAA